MIILVCYKLQAYSSQSMIQSNIYDNCCFLVKNILLSRIIITFKHGTLHAIFICACDFDVEVGSLLVRLFFMSVVEHCCTPSDAFVPLKHPWQMLDLFLDQRSG